MELADVTPGIRREIRKNDLVALPPPDRIAAYRKGAANCRVAAAATSAPGSAGFHDETENATT